MDKGRSTGQLLLLLAVELPRTNASTSWEGECTSAHHFSYFPDLLIIKIIDGSVSSFNKLPRFSDVLTPLWNITDLRINLLLRPVEITNSGSIPDRHDTKCLLKIHCGFCSKMQK